MSSIVTMTELTRSTDSGVMESSTTSSVGGTTSEQLPASPSLRLSLRGPDGATSRRIDKAQADATDLLSSKDDTDASPEMVDSGICQDLRQLTLSQEQQQQQQPPIIPSAAWQEYYEQDEDGDVQLHLAIASGYTEVVFALIRMAPHPDFLNIQNHGTRYSPLHIAVLQNQSAVVRRLVVAGARLDVRDREGNTPLHLAARRGNVECGEALLKPVSVQELREAEQQARVLSQLPVDVLDLTNSAGEHCSHLAAMGGHAHFLRFLCWQNADLNAGDGRGGRTPLHFAVGARNMAVIQCLVEPRPSGCGVNVNLVDWYNRTAYQLALLNGAPEIAHFLARRVAGCDTTAPEEDVDELEEEDEMRGAALLLNSSA